MVEWIRVSEGTGAVLGLWSRKLSARPTTGYLMTYHENGCVANCRFCPQARSSGSNPEKLSRVSWPKEEFEVLLRALSKNGAELDRICVQALNYPDVVEDVCEIVSRTKEILNVPVSVSCQPVSDADMTELKESGVDRLGIPLDAATPEVFDSIKGGSAKGPYDWSSHLEALESALEIFDGGVSTHLIVGLGESESEMVRAIQFLHDMGITLALFAFTPIEGSDLSEDKPPSVEKYRRIQLARYLIVNNLASFSDINFDDGKITNFGATEKAISSALRTGEPFRTSGCPDCNRPFYNEAPSGPIYNYPEKLNSEDIQKVKSELLS